MAAISLRLLTPCLRLYLLLVFILIARPAPSWAQSGQPTPTPDPLAGVPVQVLDQQQVTYGTHTITLKRIAPPVFPAPTPTPTPQAGANTNATSHAPRTQGVTHAAQTHSAGNDAAKAFRIVFLSATVYDHQFTALRWYAGGGSPELSVDVNIDFNYFAGVEQIETADTIYLILLGLGNDTAASLTQAGQTPPDLAAFPQGSSGYQVIAGDPTAHADDVAALKAICAYYDANEARLIAAYNQQQATNAAYQQWLQAHPPVQPDTVINYWPTKNSVFLNPAQ